MSRRLGRVLTCCSMLILLAGCEKIKSIEWPKSEDVDELVKKKDEVEKPVIKKSIYNMSLEVDAKTLDPAGIVDAYSWCVARRLFSTLVRHDPQMNLQPELAESWSVSPDGLTYTFKLRPKVRFHHGREVDSSDVAFSLARVAKKRFWIVKQIVGAKEVADGKAESLKGVSTPDRYTLIIKLTEPFPPFIQQLAMVNCAAVPREKVNKDPAAFAREPIGSGPFKLKQWLQKDRVELERFDKYFRGPAKLDGIRIRIVKELTVAYEAYQGGELDHCVVPRELMRQTLNGPQKDEVREVPNLNTRYLGITMTRTPLGTNIHLRRAINYAINRPLLYDKILGGADVPAKGVLPPGMPGYDPDLSGYTYDLEKAKSELKASGYGDHNPPPPVTLWHTTERNGNLIAQQVQADLKKIGVTLRLKTVDFPALLAATTTGEPDLFRIAWVADYPDPDNFLYILFHSGQKPDEGNRTHFADADVDALLDAARAEVDLEKRIKAYQAAERLIVDRSPWIFLSHGVTYMLVKPHVNGLALGPLDSGNAVGGVDFHPVSVPEKIIQ